MNDKNMSYPGASGISLKVDEVEQVPRIRQLLDDIVDYGNLVDADHTTKESTELDVRNGT